MISFIPLTHENEQEILDHLSVQLPEADESEISEIISSFSDSSDVEAAFSASNGCLLIRLFDSEYLFVYPVAMSDVADENTALDEMRLYSIKEEIPFTVVDIPSESLAAITSRFVHTEVFAEGGEDCESYTVRVKNEISGIDFPLEICDTNLSLTSLTDLDAIAYERIATDRELNKYWGYDYSADCSNADGAYFLKCAREELEREVSLTLAVRLNGDMIGEAILYAFDFLGGCECAIRILAEHQGRGYGRRALLMLESLARKIGVQRLYATVNKENISSVSLFAKNMQPLEENRENIRFYTYL